MEHWPNVLCNTGNCEREQISDLRLGFPYGVPVTSKENKKHDMIV